MCHIHISCLKEYLEERPWAPTAGNRCNHPYKATTLKTSNSGSALHAAEEVKNLNATPRPA